MNKLKATGPVPSVMEYNGIKLHNDNAILNSFCLYFKSVFQFSDIDTLPVCEMRNVPKFSMPYISPEHILDELKSLNTNTACGYDNVSALFIVKYVGMQLLCPSHIYL